MSKEVVKLSPEGLEIAQAYLQFGNIRATADFLSLPEDKVVQTLATREVKKYVDTVYLDMGYRNRNNIANLLDEIIASKLQEAEVSGMYSNKDLADLLQMAHKFRMDELKAQENLEKAQGTSIRSQTNVQINDGGGSFGQGNYGKLMEKLLNNAGTE